MPDDRRERDAEAERCDAHENVQQEEERHPVQLVDLGPAVGERVAAPIEPGQGQCADEVGADEAEHHEGGGAERAEGDRQEQRRHVSP